MIQGEHAWHRAAGFLTIAHPAVCRTTTGKSAAKALQSPAYAKLKNVPKVTNEEEAGRLLQSIVPFAFFLKVDRKHSISSTSSQGVKGPSMKVLEVIREQNFAPDQYYVWLIEGSQVKTLLGGVAMVTVILAGVMFPLWPTSLRIGVWYLSMAMLGVIALFFGLAIFRLIFYVLTWILVKPGIWIFPNLFADVGFVSCRLHRPATLKHRASGSRGTLVKSRTLTDVVQLVCYRWTALSQGGSGMFLRQRRRRWVARPCCRASVSHLLDASWS